MKVRPCMFDHCGEEATTVDEVKAVLAPRADAVMVEVALCLHHRHFVESGNGSRTRYSISAVIRPMPIERAQ